MQASQSPKGWLFTSLKNIIRNMRVVDNKICQRLVQLDATYPANDAENIDVLYDGIIPKKDFEILKKVYLEGYTYKRMADILDMEISTFGMRLKKIKYNFRKNFNKFKK